MKVAIIGAGVSGSTIYHLIRSKPGVDVTLFGKKWDTSCGIRPCAWGVKSKMFRSLCRDIGLNSSKYILNHHKLFNINGLQRECDMVTIDKKLFLSDLNTGNILYESPTLDNYDRVINATGVNDGKAVRYSVQRKVWGKSFLSTQVRLLPHFVCMWNFPLLGATHIGLFSTHEIDFPEQEEMICECKSTFRVGMSNKFVEGNIWKVGEAAGIIDPITGSGILPAIQSARLLVEHWDKPKVYEQAILSYFGYMRYKISALFHNEFRGIPIDSVGIVWGMLGRHWKGTK